MKEVKSTDLAKNQKRPVKLPPQKSANDTSNWEDRNVSAPHLDITHKKRTVRELEFMGNAITGSGLIIEDKQGSNKKNRHKKRSI